MIVACRGCRRGVSTEAPFCPHCGIADPYHGWSPPVPAAPAAPPAPPAARRRRPPRTPARRGGFPAGPLAIAAAAILILGAGLLLYNRGAETAPGGWTGDGYPVGQAPRREPADPATERLRRLEGQYLTGVGELISEAKLKRDNPAIDMLLLHEMANCPSLVKAMEYYLPLYVTVRNGRFVGDADGKVYDTHRLCDRCVQ